MRKSSRDSAGRVALGLLLALLLHGQAAWGSEEAFEDRPAGDSVEALDSSLTRAVEDPVRQRTLFPGVKKLLQQLPPFFADSELIAQARSYYLPLRDTDGRNAYALTIGGKLRYRSGWWREWLQLGFGFYASYPLAANDPLARTQLLRPGEEGYSVAGEGFLRLRFKEATATLYRQELDFPYVNRSFNRMTPNSFEAYLLRGEHESLGALRDVNWAAGYVRSIRPRFGDEFISMAERAGLTELNQGAASAALDSSEGMWMAGIQYRPVYELGANRADVGLYNYYVKDVLHITYLATDLQRKLGGDWAVRTQWQVTWQSSAGGDKLIGRSFHTGVFGGRTALSTRGATAWLGFSITADGEDIRSPWGTYPGALSMMQSDFNRSGEKAWMIGASYDFADRGVPGLSGFAQFAQGTGGRDPSGLDRADETEFDATLDYKIEQGDLRGLWFRLRGSLLDVEGTETLGWEVRAIVNFDIPVL